MPVVSDSDWRPKPLRPGQEKLLLFLWLAAFIGEGIIGLIWSSSRKHAIWVAVAVSLVLWGGVLALAAWVARSQGLSTWSVLILRPRPKRSDG